MDPELSDIVAMTEEDRFGLAEDIMENEKGRELRKQIMNSKERRHLGRVAANITEDRYSAGSTAARATIAILILHGLTAAKDFVADLDHHEG